MARRYIPRSAYYFPFRNEALFFALKGRYNLVQGSASLKLRITNYEWRELVFRTESAAQSSPGQRPRVTMSPNICAL